MGVRLRTRTTHLSIEYESEAFPASRSLLPSGQLPVAWDDVIWSAITIGRPNLHYVFQHGDASLYEALFRLSLVRMALEQASPYSSRLRRTEAARSLDPTEKGAVNYFLGLVFCKLFAARLLLTPWLLHLDVFRDQLAPGTLTGRSRPDLVGLETATGAWHVFECKGRLSVPNQQTKNSAKLQAQRLVSVSGQSCLLHVATITYFKSDIVRFYWRDPAADGEARGIGIRDPNPGWESYFRPVAELIASERTRATDLADGRPVVAVEGADVSIGAHPAMHTLMHRQDWQAQEN
jgi:hypothetical protein